MDDITWAITREKMTFQEAVDYFRERVPVNAETFYQIAEEYRGLAFTVSGYSAVSVLKRFYEELLAALEEGRTLQEFQANMEDFLEAEGYDGLNPFQADNIFRTNIQTAYNVGHYEQMTEPEVLKLRPYWQYDAVEDQHTRPSHLAMDGRVFPADHKVWNIWYPPNGFRCRCTVRSLSERQVKARGLRVETELPESVVPDPHFMSNPAKERFRPDLKGYPKTLVKAYQQRQAQRDA